MISWEQKRYTDAAHELEKGLELMPNFIESYSLLGDSYWHLGKPEKAIQAFEKLRDKDPDVLQTMLRKYPDVQYSYTQSLSQTKG